MLVYENTLMIEGDAFLKVIVFSTDSSSRMIFVLGDSHNHSWQSKSCKRRV